MSSNQVRISLEATDNASSVFQNMTRHIRDGVLQANLMGSAFTSALNLVQGAVGGIASQFNQAADIETQNIATQGTVMKLLGINYQEAGTFVTDFQKKMSIVAAALPGQTSDYTSLGSGLMDNLIPAFKDLNGILDKGAYSKTLESITKNVGFMAVTSGTDIKFASQAISKLLAGDSFASLKGLKFFDANPAALNFIEAEAQKLGKKFENLSARERAEVIDRALAVPQAVIDASTESIQGLTAAFQSTLFDPQTGVFGLMKDLESKAGDQTAYQEIGKTFNLIFGTTGLLANVGAIFSDLTGVNIDSPMNTLRNGFIWLNNKLTYINTILGSIKYGLSFDEAINDFKYMFSGIFRQFNPSRMGEELAIMFNGLIPTIVTMAPYAINAIAKGVLFVFNFLGEFIGSLDYGAIFAGIGTILTKLDWGTIGSIAFDVLGVAVVGALGSVAAGIFASSTIAAIIGSGVTVLGLVVTAPITLIAAAVAGLIYLVATNIDAIQSAMTDGLIATIAFMQPGIDSIKAFAINITNGFNSISATGGQILVNFENYLTYLLKLPGQLMSQAGNVLMNGQVNFTSSGVTVTTPNKATGQVGSILGAAMREQAVMPSNASLMVANSSEAILNRSQQSQVAGAIRGSSGMSFYAGGITINVANGDAKEISRQIMSELAQAWEQSKQNFSAPNYS
jgi:hypothetical protein